MDMPSYAYAGLYKFLSLVYKNILLVLQLKGRLK